MKISYMFTILLMSILLFTTGCRRKYQEKIYVEVAPNETAFVLPLEGANKEGQKKLKSIDYLNEKKVAAKRIYIPTKFHQTGRKSHVGHWIPTVMVVKVDRSPVTREWTSDGETGTERSNQALKVESKESIEWWQGVTSSASILEDDAALFLYWYSGKKLSTIMDLNVRADILDFLTKNFAMYDLDKARTKKKDIFDQCFKTVSAKYRKKGVEIETIGAAGGMNYVDEEIQKGINLTFTAAMKYKAAVDERKAAQEFAKAAQAQKKRVELDIALINAQANKIRAEKWNGSLPSNILPAGMATPFLMGNGQ